MSVDGATRQSGEGEVRRMRDENVVSNLSAKSFILGVDLAC